MFFKPLRFETRTEALQTYADGSADTLAADVAVTNGRASLGILLGALCVLTGGCGGKPTIEPVPNSLPALSRPTIPNGLDSAMVARLTERIETENFIFHFAPGDSVLAERQEAYHRWAVDFFDVSPPKKIDYYKFSTPDDMATAVGQRAGLSGQRNPGTSRGTG